MTSKPVTYDPITPPRLLSLVVAALCASGAAFAQLEEQLPTRPGLDVVLVLDNSGSMRKYDPDAVARQAIVGLAQRLDPDTRIGIVFFDAEAREALPLSPLGPESLEAVGETLAGLDYKGRLTNISAALERAIYALKENGRPEASKSVVLLTDGVLDTGDRARDLESARWLREELGTDAARLGIAVFSIALGDAADFVLLHALAQKTGGDYFRAELAEDIVAVLERTQAAIVARATPAPAAPPLSEEPATPSLPEMQGKGTPEVAPGPAEPEARAEPAPPVEPTLPPVLPTAPPPLAEDSRDQRLWVWLLGISALLGLLAMVLMRILTWVKKTARVSGAAAQVTPDQLPKAFLHDLSGVTEWKQHRFTKPVTWIGRIVMDPLPDADQLVIEKDTVGRRHALIEYRQQDFWLSDHDSVNGTFLNGRRIAAETRLKHGDRIRVGDCECEFEMPAMAIADQTSLLVPGTLRGAIARQERRVPQDAVREGSGEVAARPQGALGLGEISEDRLALRAMAAGQEDITEPVEESPAATGPRTVATPTTTRPSKQEALEDATLPSRKALKDRKDFFEES